MSDLRYEKDEKKKDNYDFENSPFGIMLAIIFGEVIKYDLKYTEGGLAYLNITISTKMPYKRNFKYYYNRVTVWKDQAETLARIIQSRDKDKKTNGTFLLLLCNKFGGEKLANENFSHNFSVSRYRIIEDINDFLEQINSNQDPGTLKIGNLFNIDF